MPIKALWPILVIIALAWPAGAAVARPAADEGLAPDIAVYAIDVQLDPVIRSLDGVETIAYRNTTTRPMPDLVFHLYLNAFKDTETIFMQESGPQHRGNPFQKENNGWIEVNGIRLADGTELTLELLEDGTLARAALPEPVQPDETVKLELTFTAKLPQVFARTGWALDAQAAPFFMVGQWFPKLGVWTTDGWNAYPFHSNSEFFADFGAYSVNITLPQEYFTAATGLPAGSIDNGDGTQTVSYQADDVIDFAWTASPNLKEAVRRVGDVEVYYVYLPEHEWTVERVLDVSEKALVDYGKWFGAYPYARLTVVDVPDAGQGAGGMEYPTLVTAGAMDMLGLGGAPVQAGWELSLELVTAHEIGHQWWQSMVAFNEAEEPWLDEGITDYSTARLMNAEYGEGVSAFDVADIEVGYVDSRRAEYLASPETPMVGNAWDFQMLQYGVAAYSKPTLSLLTLEGVLGEEMMLKVMSTFFQRYRFQHPTTDDFRATAQEVSGQDLDWFFEGLVHGEGTLNYVAGEIAGQSITVVRQGDLVIPTEIEVVFSDGTTRRVPWEGALPQEQIDFDRPVQSYSIDPDHKLIIERVWSDNGRLVRADLPAWLAVVTRLIYHLQDWMLMLGGI
jgi:hypothetical protein